MSMLQLPVKEGRSWRPEIRLGEVMISRVERGVLGSGVVKWMDVFLAPCSYRYMMCTLSIHRCLFQSDHGVGLRDSGTAMEPDLTRQGQTNSAI